MGEKRAIEGNRLRLDVSLKILREVAVGEGGACHFVFAEQ